MSSTVASKSSADKYVGNNPEKTTLETGVKLLPKICKVPSEVSKKFPLCFWKFESVLDSLKSLYCSRLYGNPKPLIQS